MSNSLRKKLIYIILIGFMALDFIYAVICFAFPELWYETFHSSAYVDPAGLLQRTGALWAAFAVFHFIAAIRWQKESYWLAVIAGMRFTELFADWIYIYFAGEMTWMGKVGLAVSTPFNFLVSIFLLRSFLKRRWLPDLD